MERALRVSPLEVGPKDFLREDCFTSSYPIGIQSYLLRYGDVFDTVM